MTLKTVTRRGCGVLVLAAGLLLAVPSLAQSQTAAAVRPVLLELYTSQGCASCPPADEMMVELAARDDVIALALHVDYWDYIGWPDTFADRRHTDRQQAYARRHGHSTIYTPQVVVNGIELIEGFRTMQVMDSIAAHSLRPVEVRMTLERGEQGLLHVRATPTVEMAPGLAMASRRSAMPGTSANAVIGSLSMSRPDETARPSAEPAVDDEAAAAEAEVPRVLAAVAPTGPYVVQLVRYVDTQVVEILGGENAGRTATYANVVTDWVTVANWDMIAPLDLTLPLDGTDHVVVLIQEVAMGEVIAVARLH